jgi:hypothetical protein
MFTLFAHQKIGRARARTHRHADRIVLEDRGRSAGLAGSMTAMSKVTMGEEHLQLVSNKGGADALMGNFPVLRITTEATFSIKHHIAALPSANSPKDKAWVDRSGTNLLETVGRHGSPAKD